MAWKALSTIAAYESSEETVVKQRITPATLSTSPSAQVQRRPRVIRSATNA
jgi:hypothetical protein